jgi:hypothetical protein
VTQERIERVRVLNTNPFMIEDRHNGARYRFRPNVPEVIPADVAGHIFAFPGEEEEMHRHMARRWGWNRPEHCAVDDTGLMKWQRMCQAITIASEHYELRRVAVDDGRDSPAELAADAAENAPLIRDEPKPRRAAVGRRKVKAGARGGRRGPQRRPRAEPPQPISPRVPLTLAEAVPKHLQTPEPTETVPYEE